MTKVLYEALLRKWFARHRGQSIGHSAVPVFSVAAGSVFVDCTGVHSPFAWCALCSPAGEVPMAKPAKVHVGAHG